MTDTEREWTIDAREQTCKQCEREYRSLSQHWARSADCSYRELTDHQHETIRGLLLGDGSLGGRESPSLRVESVRREHIAWLHDELGWLSRGVSRFEKNGSTVYRLTTMSHPALGRYLAWQSAPPQLGWTLTRRTARVWYACDGSLSAAGRDGETSQISFAAMDESKQAALVAALDRAGFEAQAWDRRIGLAKSAVRDWLDWLGDPTPGSEDKWALDPDVARQLRTADASVSMERSEWYRELLALVAEAIGVGHELSRSTFDAAFAGVSAATVADWLGGGSWDDAKRVAALRGRGNRPSKRAGPARQGRATGPYSSYDERACQHALCRVANHLDTAQLSIDAYNAARWDVEPAAAAIIRQAEKWSTALGAVGLEPGDCGAQRENPGQVTDGKCERALELYTDAVAGRLTIAKYDRWRAEDNGDWPHSDTIARRLGDGSWTDAVGSVRARLSDD